MKFFKICLHFMRIHSILIDARILIKKKTLFFYLADSSISHTLFPYALFYAVHLFLNIC